MLVIIFEIISLKILSKTYFCDVDTVAIHCLIHPFLLKYTHIVKGVAQLC